MKLLDTIPGVAETVAQIIVSEIGVDMNQFASDKQLASWAGMCPGNNESAGKRRSGKTRKGNRYLRAVLVQAAWVASHQKETYLAAQYKRMVKRMGKKKALVAVGHTIVVIVWHVLKKKTSYQELGGDYFDRRYKEQQKKRLIKQLESLGFKVTVENLSELLDQLNLLFSSCLLTFTLLQPLQRLSLITLLRYNPHPSSFTKTILQTKTPAPAKSRCAVSHIQPVAKSYCPALPIGEVGTGIRVGIVKPNLSSVLLMLECSGIGKLRKPEAPILEKSI